MMICLLLSSCLCWVCVLFICFCCPLWVLEVWDSSIFSGRKLFWEPVTYGHWDLQVKFVSRHKHQFIKDLRVTFVSRQKHQFLKDNNTYRCVQTRKEVPEGILKRKESRMFQKDLCSTLGMWIEHEMLQEVVCYRAGNETGKLVLKKWMEW